MRKLLLTVILATASIRGETAFGEVHATAFDSESGTILGGNFGQRFLLRRTEDGRWDEAFNDRWQGRLNGAVRAITILADGSMILGGDFTEIAGQAVAHLARFDRHGALDLDFIAELGSGFDAPVHAVTMTSAGLFITGDFTNVDGVEARYMTLLRPSGEREALFQPQVSLEAPLKSVSFDHTSGYLLLGGAIRRDGQELLPFVRLSERGEVVEQLIELHRDN